MNNIIRFTLRTAYLFSAILLVTLVLLAAFTSTNTSHAADSTDVELAPSTLIPLEPVKFRSDTNLAEQPDIYELAQDPFGRIFQWKQVSDSDWTARSLDTTHRNGISNDAMILFEYTRAKDRPRYGASVLETYFRRRILNAAGKDEYADVEYQFPRGLFDSVQVLGRTVLPDGRIVPLDTSLIVRREIETIHGDTMTIVSFSLPGVTDDCIIEYYLRYIDYTGSSHIWNYQSDLPTISARYFWYPAVSKLRFDKSTSRYQRVIEELERTYGLSYRITSNRLTPDDRSSAYVWQNTVGAIDTKTLPENSPNVLVFSAKNVPAFEPEPYSIPDDLQRARVFMYRTSQSSTNRYWKNSARSFRAVFESYALKSKRLKKAIKKIKKDIPLSKWIDAAYSWTQETVMNTNYDDWYLGKFQSNEHKKRKKKNKRKRKKSKKKDVSLYIDDTLKKGYGSSVEVTLIFDEALKELGFESYTAFVTSRDSVVFSANLPYWQFDHLIVLVKTDSVTYRAYDPAIPYLAPGELRWQNEGVTALVVGDNDELFISTPMNLASENTLVRSLSIDHIDDHEWSGRSTERLRGQMATELRAALWPHDSAYHIQEVKRLLFPDNPAVEIDSLAISGVWNRGEPLVIDFSIRKQHLAASAGNRLFVSLKDIFGEFYSPFINEERLKPIIFDFPYTVTDNAIIELGETWKLETKPDDVKHFREYVDCQLAINSFSGAVSIQKLFRVKAPFVSHERYVEIRDLFDTRESFNEQVLSLTKNQ